jgi:hypothetical protein
MTAAHTVVLKSKDNEPIGLPRALVVTVVQFAIAWGLVLGVGRWFLN